MLVGFVVVLVLLVLLGFVLAILAASGVVASQGWAKKQAKSMIDNEAIDKTKVKRVLKILSVTRDHEAKRLYDKLASLSEA